MADGQITTGIQVNMDFQANYSQLQMQLGQVLAKQAQMSQVMGDAVANLNKLIQGYQNVGQVSQQSMQQTMESMNKLVAAQTQMTTGLAKMDEAFLKTGRSAQQLARSAQSGMGGISGLANQSASALRTQTQGVQKLNAAFDAGVKKQDGFFNNMGMRLIGSAFSMYFLVRQIQNITNALEKMDVLRASYARIMTANVGEAQIGRASEQMMRESAQIAYKYGATMSDVAGTMVEFARQGRSEAEIKYLTASLGELRLMLATSTGRFLSMNDAMKSATTLMTQMDVSVYEAIDALKLMSEYDVRAATSFDQISIAMNRFAAAGKVAGMSVEEIIRVATAFTEIGVGGSRAGTALNTIISRLSGTKDAIKAIQNMNVAMTTMEGGTLRATSAFEQLVDAYRKVVATGSSTQLNQFLSAVGGTRQRSVLAAGLNRYIKQTSSPVSAQEFKPMVDNLYKELNTALTNSSPQTVKTTSGLRSRSFVSEDIISTIRSNLYTLRKSMEDEFSRTGGVSLINLTSLLSSWFKATPTEVQQIMSANQPLFDSISQQFELFALKTESVYSRIARIAKAETDNLKAQRDFALSEMESTVTVQKNRLITLFEGTFLTAGFIDPFRAGVSALTDGIETLSQTIIGAIGGILQVASGLGSVLPSAVTGYKAGDSNSARGVKTIMTLAEGYLLSRMPFIMSGLFTSLTNGIGSSLVAPIVGQVQKARAISQGVIPGGRNWLASGSGYESLISNSIETNLTTANNLSSLVNKSYGEARQLTDQIADNQGVSVQNLRQALSTMQDINKLNKQYGLQIKPGDDILDSRHGIPGAAWTPSSTPNSVLAQISQTTGMSSTLLNQLRNQNLSLGNAISVSNLTSIRDQYQSLLSQIETKMSSRFVSSNALDTYTKAAGNLRGQLSEINPLIDKMNKGLSLSAGEAEAAVKLAQTAPAIMTATQNAVKGIGLTLAGLQTGLAWIGTIAGWIGIIAGIGSVIYGLYQRWQKSNADAITNVDSLTESLRKQKEAAEGLGRAVDDLNKSMTAIGQAYGIQESGVSQVFGNSVIRNMITSRLGRAAQQNLASYEGLTADKVEQRVAIDFDKYAREYEDYREEQRQRAVAVGVTEGLRIIDELPGLLKYVAERFGLMGDAADRFANNVNDAAKAIGVDLQQADENVRTQISNQVIAASVAREIQENQRLDFYGANYVNQLGPAGRPDKWSEAQNAAATALWEEARDATKVERETGSVLLKHLNSFSNIIGLFTQEYVSGRSDARIREIATSLAETLKQNEAYLTARAFSPDFDLSRVETRADWDKMVNMMGELDVKLGNILVPAITQAIGKFTTGSNVRFNDTSRMTPTGTGEIIYQQRSWSELPESVRQGYISQYGSEAEARRRAGIVVKESTPSTQLTEALKTGNQMFPETVNLSTQLVEFEAKTGITQTPIMSSATDRKTVVQQSVDTAKGILASIPDQIDELQRRYDYKDLNDLVAEAQETGDWSKAQAYHDEYNQIMQRQVDAGWAILDNLQALRDESFKLGMAKSDVITQNTANDQIAGLREQMTAELNEANNLVNELTNLDISAFNADQRASYFEALEQATQKRDELEVQLRELNEAQKAFGDSVLDYALAYREWTDAKSTIAEIEKKGQQATEQQIKARDEAKARMDKARDNMLVMLDTLNVNINNAQKASVEIGNGLNKILTTLGQQTFQFDSAFLSALDAHKAKIDGAIAQVNESNEALKASTKQATEGTRALAGLSTTPPPNQTPREKAEQAALRTRFEATISEEGNRADREGAADEKAGQQGVKAGRTGARRNDSTLRNAMKGKKGRSSQKDPARDLLQQLQQEHQERLQDIAIMYKTLQDEAGNIIGYMDRTGGVENQRSIIQEQQRYIADLNTVLAKIKAAKDKAKVSRMIASETAKLLEFEHKLWEYEEKMAQYDLKYQLEDLDRPRRLAIDMSDLSKLNSLLSEEYDLQLKIIKSQWDLAKKDEATVQAIRRTFSKTILKDFESGLKDIITVVDQLNERFEKLQSGGMTSARELLFQHRMEYQSRYASIYPHANFNWVARTSQAHMQDQLADLNARSQHNLDLLNEEVAQYTRAFATGLNPLVNTGEISTQEAESIFKGISEKVAQQVEAGQMAQEAGEYVTNLLRNGSGLVAQEFDASRVHSLIETYKGQFEDFVSSLDVTQELRDALAQEFQDTLLTPLLSDDLTSEAVNNAISEYRKTVAGHRLELSPSIYEKLGSLIAESLTPATTPTSLSASYAASYMSQVKNTLARQVSLGNISQEVMDAVMSVYTDALKTGFKDASFNEQALAQMLKDKQAEIKASLPADQTSELEQQFNSATQAIVAGAPLDITTFLKTYQQMGDILRSTIGKRVLDDLQSFESQYITIRREVYNSLDFSQLRDNALIDDVFTESDRKVRFNYSNMQAVLSQAIEKLYAIQQAYDQQDTEALLEMFGERREIIQRHVDKAIAYGWDDETVRARLYIMLTEETRAMYDSVEKGLAELQKRWNDWVSSIETTLKSGWDEGFDIGFEYGFTSEGWDKLAENMRKRVATGIKDAIWKQIAPNLKGMFTRMFSTIDKEATEVAVQAAKDKAAEAGREATASELADATVYTTGMFGGLFGGIFAGLFSSLIGFALGALFTDFTAQAQEQLESQLKQQRDSINAQGFNWSYKEADTATPYYEFSPPTTTESIKIVKLSTSINITTEAAAAMISQRRELERICSELVDAYFRAAYKTVGASV